MVEQTKKQEAAPGYSSGRPTSLFNEVGLGMVPRKKAVRTVINKPDLPTEQAALQPAPSKVSQPPEDPESSKDAVSSVLIFILVWIALPAWLLDHLFWLLGH